MLRREVAAGCGGRGGRGGAGVRDGRPHMPWIGCKIAVVRRAGPGCGTAASDGDPGCARNDCKIAVA